jgi:hypothetical protein
MIEAEARPSLRSMSATLAARGYLNRAGERYHASAVKRMVERIEEERPELRRCAALDIERATRMARIAKVMEVAA